METVLIGTGIFIGTIWILFAVSFATVLLYTAWEELDLKTMNWGRRVYCIVVVWITAFVTGFIIPLAFLADAIIY